MKVERQRTPQELAPAVTRLFELASDKTKRIAARWQVSMGAPVVTRAGEYAGRNWTQWTQGFAYGNAILCYDITRDAKLLQIGRDNTLQHMAEHITHIGVHDHGFNNLSTYGQLRRLMQEGIIPQNEWEMNFYELALKSSGAVQAARWTDLPDGEGFIHSFNGSHSLFIDTMRTIRICGVAHTLGHTLLGEQDRSISLLERLLTHAKTSSRFNIYYGEGRDSYDTPELRGRTVHEAVFNPKSGTFRCPSTQQGYSAFTTWTRGLAWAMLGYTEELEFLATLPESDFTAIGESKADALALMKKAARATCDFYIHQGTASDGICYWDTGAVQMHKLGDWMSRPADPFNDYEPVDSSASAIAAQGLLRLGRALGKGGETYFQAGLAVADALLQEPYLSTSPAHEGILLHSIYHRPNGWDYTPPGAKIPQGESSMWGDYHMLELGLLLHRLGQGKYYTFFDAE
ncbi:glycoside hydrolase family 88 protein [Terriglobus sp. TAA 43]|uniref:glycoside hydrolase family 88 protein n=1 Tax=Terriglobus sp. TAA 43 TaxID=278961 RepID=UPI00064622B7|nr:glycoside hydrolase family 88 protein [Terriglobus sp. TAA 43]